MEDLVSASSSTSSAVSPSHPPIVTKHRRTLTSSQRVQLLQRETWRDVLGPPPSMGTSKVLPPSDSSLCMYHTPFQGRSFQMYFTFGVWYIQACHKHKENTLKFFFPFRKIFWRGFHTTRGNGNFKWSADRRRNSCYDNRKGAWPSREVHST